MLPLYVCIFPSLAVPDLKLVHVVSIYISFLTKIDIHIKNNDDYLRGHSYLRINCTRRGKMKWKQTRLVFRKFCRTNPLFPPRETYRWYV